MVSKVVIFCATAILIQTTFGQSLRNIEVTSECGCSSTRSSSRSRSSNGSGSVRAIGIGSFRGGKFVSGSSCNTESSSSSNSESSDCIVFNASEGSTDPGLSLINIELSGNNAGSCASEVGLSSNAGIISNAGLNARSSTLSNARSSSNSGIIVSNAGCRLTNVGAVSGGPFIITSSGPVVPSGISVNAYSDLYGDLVLSGELPFLSAVAFDGAFQNAGKATVSYGCGDGNIAIRDIIGAKPGSCGYIL